MFDWLWGFLSKFQGWLIPLLPDWMGTGFADLSAAMGPSVKYLAYLAGLDTVMPVVIGAYITKFLIRRIPIIG